MKKLLLFIFLSISCFTTNSIAQEKFEYIDSLSILPSNVAQVTDTLKLVCSSNFLYSPCLLDSSRYTINGSVIKMQGFYKSGFLTALCDRIDTIKIGRLPKQTYTLIFTMFHLEDSIATDTILFTVVGNTAFVEDRTITETIDVYPNPSTNNLTINLPLATDKEPLWIIVRDSRGTPVITQQYTAQTLVPTNHLPAGMYVVQAFSSTRFVASKKWVKIE